MKKRDYQAERQIEKEVKSQTSIDSTIGQLADFLTGSGAMPQPTRSSAGGHSLGSDGETVPAGMPKPEPFHMEADTLLQKLGGGGPVMAQPAYPMQPQQPQQPQQPPRAPEAEYTVSQSGNLVLRRKAASVPSVPGYPPAMQMPYQPYPPQQYAFSSNDANEILGELMGFSFSPETREYELDIIKTAIRDAVGRLKAQKVAQNTKNLSKNAESFTRTKTGGIRGIFRVLGIKISMRVEGEFRGDETFYLTIEEGENAVGLVLRKDPYGRLVNASDGFDITVERLESDQ